MAAGKRKSAAMLEANRHKRITIFRYDSSRVTNHDPAAWDGELSPEIFNGLATLIITPQGKCTVTSYVDRNTGEQSLEKLPAVVLMDNTEAFKIDFIRYPEGKLVGWSLKRRGLEDSANFYAWTSDNPDIYAKYGVDCPSDARLMQLSESIEYRKRCMAMFNIPIKFTNFCFYGSYEVGNILSMDPVIPDPDRVAALAIRSSDAVNQYCMRESLLKALDSEFGEVARRSETTARKKPGKVRSLIHRRRSHLWEFRHRCSAIRDAHRWYTCNLVLNRNGWVATPNATNWQIWFYVGETDHLSVLEAIAESPFMSSDVASLLSGRTNTAIDTDHCLENILFDGNKSIIEALDRSQMKAVRNAAVMSTGDAQFSLIQGPPGTGKSSVVTGIVSVWLGKAGEQPAFETFASRLVQPALQQIDPYGPDDQLCCRESVFEFSKVVHQVSWLSTSCWKYPLARLDLSRC